jgi:predicted nucleic acid-binding protein
LLIHSTSLSNELDAVNLSKELSLDLDDALQYAVALSTGAECIVSYDKHFDGLKVVRKQPAELIA